MNSDDNDVEAAVNTSDGHGVVVSLMTGRAAADESPSPSSEKSISDTESTQLHQAEEGEVVFAKNRNGRHASSRSDDDEDDDRRRLNLLTTTMASFRSGTKQPKETLKAVYQAGQYKAGLTLGTLAVQSSMAGIYIAMAGHLFLSVGGGILGAALFPTGLIAVVLTSGELFTGDALIFVASWLGGKIQLQSLIRNWTVSWLCNFVGALCWAFVLGYASEALAEQDRVGFAIAVAEKKANQAYLSTFLKGIGANFLVCVGVWQATCAEEVAGKVLALWFPIMGFVTMGFDHCIANQFFLPLGMMLGADVSFGRMIGALAMATFGNILGGGLFVGAVYWYVFDSLSVFQGMAVKIRQGVMGKTQTHLFFSKRKPEEYTS